MKSTREILKNLQENRISIEEAEKQLRALYLTEVEQLGVMDLEREARSGIPEVVYAESKSASQVLAIVEKGISIKGAVLISRLDNEKMTHLRKETKGIEFIVRGNESHLTVIAHSPDWTAPDPEGKIAVITAGTSDIVFAEEAVLLAHYMGVEALTFYDIGVAGIHRIIEPLNRIIEEEVHAIIVFAGMEGALPTVIASLVDVPVIGVPVPVGYGHGGDGETALSAMLQSCALGLAVVNIGNGLGAGAIACLIAKNAVKRNRSQGNSS